jgi:hypothetical protein
LVRQLASQFGIPVFLDVFDRHGEIFPSELGLFLWERLSSRDDRG